MKKIYQKILLIALTITMISGMTIPANAASVEESFEEIIKDDIFKFNNEVTFSNSNDKLKIVEEYTEDLDDEIYIEITDVTNEPIIVGYSTVHRVEKARHYYIRRKSDKKVMVQFSLHGIFAYDGNKSQCTDTRLNVYNNASASYLVTQKTHWKSGMWANATCTTHNTKSGKIYNRTIKIGVKPDGTVLKS